MCTWIEHTVDEELMTSYALLFVFTVNQEYFVCEKFCMFSHAEHSYAYFHIFYFLYTAKHGALCLVRILISYLWKLYEIYEIKKHTKYS